MGLPRRLTEDDEFEGYSIPKGSTVIPNSWAIAHDKEMYPHPEEFNPDRFLISPESTTPPPMDPRLYVFGYGRRMCPGMYFAESVVWASVVSVLSTTTIKCPLDPITGKEYTPAPEFTGGLVSQVVPFKLRVEVRSRRGFEMAKEEAAAAAL